MVPFRGSFEISRRASPPFLYGSPPPPPPGLKQITCRLSKLILASLLGESVDVLTSSRLKCVACRGGLFSKCFFIPMIVICIYSLITGSHGQCISPSYLHRNKTKLPGGHYSWSEFRGKPHRYNEDSLGSKAWRKSSTVTRSLPGWLSRQASACPYKVSSTSVIQPLEWNTSS